MLFHLHKYAAFLGLNLSFETREGIVKHHSAHDHPQSHGLVDYKLHEQATLEAQIGNLADEIAYNNHDVDDGCRAGMLTIAELNQLELFECHFADVQSLFPNVGERLKVNETVRRMINFLIVDVIEETGRRIREANVQSLNDVRCAAASLVGFSRPVRHMNAELKRYLYKHMYKHYRVARMASKAERVVSEIFHAYMGNPSMLPESQQLELQSVQSEHIPGPERRARIIADYIAGMTDRYALEEYERLFNVSVRA